MKTDILVCIPCFNCEHTIYQVLKPLLTQTSADILLVDDQSDEPLEPLIRARFRSYEDRISVVRPDQKLYSGGGKNLGIQRALKEGYDYIVLMDSDVIVDAALFNAIRSYFTLYRDDVVVAPAILPDGSTWQFADTLINFSNYLPDPKYAISQRTCLAGYAFALNLAVFSQHAFLHDERYGGEDVLFFHELGRRFNRKTFPILNFVPVRHLPPRFSREHALHAQKRYGQSFFVHCDSPREALFHRFPWLHYLTPRFGSMVSRLCRRQRWSDLRFAARCWRLDFARARQIVRLYTQGYRDPTVAANR